MRVLDVCSGIGTTAVAWHSLGWQHLCFAEIEKFPSAVLKHRWSSVPNEGDFTKIGDKYRGPADLLVGGTPCQSFSVAGLRGGLADDRGNLALEFLRLADRTRPRWVVWENVPGVLSSLSHAAPDPCPPPPPVDLGCDGAEVETEDEYRAEELHAFNCFLAGLSELGYGWAYRVLDAQHFGVPQRRRRVFVVGYLGDWRRAAAVLFERHSLQGNHPPRREARKGITGGVEVGPSGGRLTDTHPTLDTRCKDGFIRNQLGGGVLTGGFFDNPLCVETAPTIRAGGNRTGGDRPPGTDVDTADSLIVTHSLRADGFDASEVVGPLVSGHTPNGHGCAGVNSQAVEAGHIIPILEAGARTGKSTDDIRAGIGIGTDGDPMFTLRSGKQHAVAFNHKASSHQSMNPGEVSPTLEVGKSDGVCVAIRTAQTSANGHGVAEDVAHTLDGANGQAVAFTQNQAGDVLTGDVMHSLGTNPNATGRNAANVAVAFKESQSGTRTGDVHATLDANKGSRRMEGVMSGMAVRRLTPLECERLQGLPDFYTLVPFNGKMAADGPRYKAIGNGMAVPVIRWIGERINVIEASRNK